jgi:hypothetical protein
VFRALLSYYEICFTRSLAVFLSEAGLEFPCGARAVQFSL